MSVRYPPCKYNKEVNCTTKGLTCDTCGWNPQVAWDRLSNYDIFPDYESLPNFGYMPGDVVYIYWDRKLHPYTMMDDIWRPAQYE